MLGDGGAQVSAPMHVNDHTWHTLNEITVLYIRSYAMKIYLDGSPLHIAVHGLRAGSGPLN